MQYRGRHQALPDHHIAGEPGGPVADTSALSYVQQRSSDLVYYLFEDAAPRDLVRVLAERKLSLRGGEVTLAVIGSSHFLEAVAGDVIISEMLVSRRPPLEGLPDGVRPGAAGEWRRELRRDGMIYRFEFHSSRCSPEELDRDSARLALSAPNRLTHVFPSRAGETGAITCIEWKLEDSRITVETYHTFPEEPAIVRSRSVVDLPERGGAS